MTDEFKWKKVDSQEIHKNPWYRIMQDNVIMPSGQLGKYTYIKRSAGVIIGAVTKDQKIFLVGQYRYPIKKFTWELPMGTLEAGEDDIEMAAKRELREEVGVEAENWQQVGQFHYCSGLSEQKGYVFLARKIQLKQAQPDFTEFLTMKKVSLAEFEAMIVKGEVTDSPSITAFYLLKSFLEKNENN